MPGAATQELGKLVERHIHSPGGLCTRHAVFLDRPVDPPAVLQSWLANRWMPFLVADELLILPSSKELSIKAG